MLVLGEENRRYSDAPFDVVGPTAPTLLIDGGNSTDHSITVSVQSPSIDTRHATNAYVFEIATNPAGPWTELTAVGRTLAESGYEIVNLLPSTVYYVRARGRDSSAAQNCSPTYSPVVSGTTTAPSGAGAGYWPNWPMMNVAIVQGAALNDTVRIPIAHAADRDVLAHQSFWITSTRMSQRVTAANNIRAAQDPAKMVTKLYQYLTPNVTFKVAPASGDGGEREFSRQLIDDPTKGNVNWRVRRLSGAACETLFAPTTDNQVNVTKVAGLNSLGQTYAEAYWGKYDTNWSSAYKGITDGIFHDVVTQRPAAMTVNNGATPISDQDYDQDGVIDVLNAFGPSATGQGGRLWCEGELWTRDVFESLYPGKFILPNSARWAFDFFDNNPPPPLPLSGLPFYRKWNWSMAESNNNNLSLTGTSTGYNSAAGAGQTGRLSAYFRTYAIQEKFLKPDSQIPAALGKGCVVMHAVGPDRAPLAADYEYGRLISLLPLLVERACTGWTQSANRLVTLDETLVSLGNPKAVRSMGTLSESTLAFTMRAANFVAGTAQFWWAEFDNAIVIVRGDQPTPGAYPSADAAVNCTLPPAGAGMKWQRLNAATYVNPKTGRATKNQTPTLNSGADITSGQIALKPFHAVLLLRVPA